MSEVRIAAEPRTEFGKGAARRTRRAGKIPAVMYGHGQDPVHIALPAREFGAALRRGGGNTLLSIELNGSRDLALPKQVQRDPIRGDIEHVDLIIVKRGEKVTVSVPVILTGDAVVDGLVNQELTVLEIEAEATHLPDNVEVSIAGMAIGSHLKAGDITLPTGSILITDAEHLVVSILAAPTAAQLEAELAEATGTGVAEAAEPQPATAEA
ncbi:MAG TPA: 50S ribosomal protein L25/general stress protein Ctc [Mycobacteriales bacterium]|nr:50S ribosomal protein L25/general stress protein Ctc [Mycobacteriales bacterium]